MKAIPFQSFHHIQCPSLGTWMLRGIHLPLLYYPSASEVYDAIGNYLGTGSVENGILCITPVSLSREGLASTAGQGVPPEASLDPLNPHP